MEVADDNNGVEALAGKWPVCAFQIDHAGFDTRHRRQSRERDRVAIRRDDPRLARGKKPRVPALPGREVKHPGATRDERGKADDPGRGSLVGHGRRFRDREGTCRAPARLSSAAATSQSTTACASMRLALAVERTMK